MLHPQGESTPIKKLGTSIKNLGLAEVGVFIVIIFLAVAMISNMISSIRNSSSVEEAIIGVRRGLTIFLILILLLSLLVLFFVYRLYQALKHIRVNQRFDSPSINKAEYLIQVYMVLQIFGFAISVYFMNVVLNDLDALASSNPTDNDIEMFANDITSREEIIYNGLFGMIINGVLLMVFNSVQNWLRELHHETHIFGFLEAEKKMGIVKIGLGLVVIGEFINFVTVTDDAADLLGLIGFIIYIVGLIQAGNRFERLPLNIFEGKVQKPQQSNFDLKYSETKPLDAYAGFQQNLEYCSACGNQVPPNSQFCTKCGSKLLN